MKGPLKITEAEEGFCQDYVAGLDLLTCFRRNYPNDNRKDNKARHQSKIILQREHIAIRIKFLQELGNYDKQVTADTIKAKLWEWTNSMAGKPGGIAAIRILAKDAGIGLEKINVEDNTGLVELQHNIFERRLARLEGREVPALFEVKASDKEKISEADYEIIEDQKALAEVRELRKTETPRIERFSDSDFDDVNSEDDESEGDFEWEI